MNFEEWKKQRDIELGDAPISGKEIWGAATKAGREACAELMDEVGAALQTEDKSNDYWMGVGAMADAAELAIRERSNCEGKQPAANEPNKGND